MRKLFPGHFRPKKEEFDQIWQECIFVFDANVLLDVYRYTPSTRDRLLDIMQKLQDRIWLPHQVVKEYLGNRLIVISQQEKTYDDIDKLLRTTFETLEKHRRHPSIDFDELSMIYRSAYKKAQIALRKARLGHPDLIENDPLAEKLADIFSERVGDPYKQERYAEIQKEADIRIAAKIPPGYKDSKKPDPYGDIVLWSQIIDHAKSKERQILLVTNDVKEDWWREHEGKTLGPRSELVAEMQGLAGVQFYMYRTEQFIKLAEEFLGLNEQPSAIEEIRDIQQQDEAARLQLDFAIPMDQVPPLLERFRGELDANSLRQHQAKALTTDSFQSLTADQAKRLASNSFQSLTVDQAKRLATDAFQTLTADQAKRLASDSFQSLTADQAKLAGLGSVAQIYEQLAKTAGVGLYEQLAKSAGEGLYEQLAKSAGEGLYEQLAKSAGEGLYEQLAKSVGGGLYEQLLKTAGVGLYEQLLKTAQFPEASQRIIGQAQTIEYPKIQQPKRRPKQSTTEKKDPLADTDKRGTETDTLES